jgi:ribosomal protein S18 acetylase RimI-like enzyme
MENFEFRVLTPQWKQELVTLFTTLVVNGDEKYFHPHPLTEDEAERLCNYSGRDLYYICTIGAGIFGYGMLRGWDEGYKIPSLGIVIHPDVRGIGLGKAFMHFLHAIARYSDAETIRLKVHSDNKITKALYQKLGYKFENHIGYLKL